MEQSAIEWDCSANQAGARHERARGAQNDAGAGPATQERRDGRVTALLVGWTCRLKCFRAACAAYTIQANATTAPSCCVNKKDCFQQHQVSAASLHWREKPYKLIRPSSVPAGRLTQQYLWFWKGRGTTILSLTCLHFTTHALIYCAKNPSRCSNGKNPEAAGCPARQR
eukprot:365175-Chlamydomonas_euryale.AAC.13